MNDPKDKTRLVFDLGETAQCLFLAKKLQDFTIFCTAKKRSDRALISSRVTRLSLRQISVRLGLAPRGRGGRVHATFTPILWGKRYISGDIICITQI